MNNVIVLDCTPQFADVVSGAVPHPRERRDDENPVEWLIESTPAWQRLLSHFDLLNTDFSVEDRPDLEPPTSLGLSDFPHVYALGWHESPRLRAVILLVNPDGTRCAILDAWDEIVRLWALEAKLKQSPGRPRIETDNPKTLAQRKWRDSKTR